MTKKQLHIISTGRQTETELIEKVAQIHSYIDFLHLRERNWTAQQFISVIEALIDMGVPREKIVINDRVDVAVKTNVGGVQLASHSIDATFVKQQFPYLKIGCSVHSIEEANIQEKAGAHFLMYGHVFQTQSKANLPPRGLDSLRQIVNRVDIPIIAIGGVKPENMNLIFSTGAAGVAVLSGVLLAKDVKRAVERYSNQLMK